MKRQIAALITFIPIVILEVPALLPCSKQKHDAAIAYQHPPAELYDFIQVRPPFTEVSSGSSLSGSLEGSFSGTNAQDIKIKVFSGGSLQEIKILL